VKRCVFVRRFTCQSGPEPLDSSPALRASNAARLRDGDEVGCPGKISNSAEIKVC